jgi:hypothetical protein
MLDSDLAGEIACTNNDFVDYLCNANCIAHPVVRRGRRRSNTDAFESARAIKVERAAARTPPFSLVTFNDIIKASARVSAIRPGQDRRLTKRRWRTIKNLDIVEVDALLRVSPHHDRHLAYRRESQIFRQPHSWFNVYVLPLVHVRVLDPNRYHVDVYSVKFSSIC